MTTEPETTADHFEVGLPWDIRVEIEVLADQFEHRLREGANVELSNILSVADHLPRTATLQLLLETEISFRMSQPTEVSESDYLDQFPDEQEIVHAAMDRVSGCELHVAITRRGVGNAGSQHVLHAKPFVQDYRLEGVIGSGAAGVVYRAVHIPTDEVVAMKIIRSEPLASGDPAATFQAIQDEVIVLKQLNHPHILPVKDSGCTDDSIWFAMPYVSGTMRELISDSPIEPRRAAQIIQKIASALHIAHRERIIHRDIKPGNILIAANDHPFVADFGIAMTSNEFGTGPDYAGTPLYMSPEQASGAANFVDGRTDIFSLGIVFYQLLTGVHPFDSPTATTEDIKYRIRNLRRRPIRQLVDIPAALERVCLKTLAVDVDERYSTAGDMAQDLASFLETLPANGGPSHSLDSEIDSPNTNRPVSARRLVILGILGFVALGIAIGIWNSVQEGESQPSASTSASVIADDDLLALNEEQLILCSNGEQQSIIAAYVHLQELMNGRQSGEIPPDDFWSAFARQDDPTIRSLLVERLPVSGVPVSAVVDQLRVEVDPGVFSALVQALGGYEIESPVWEDLRPWLRQEYWTRTDSGVHSSIRWLFSLRGEQEQLRPDPSVDYAAESQRGWYITKHAHEMAIISGSNHSQIGSPTDEVGREKTSSHLDEALRAIAIPYDFAISTTEVTADQWWRATSPTKRDAVPAIPDLPRNRSYWNNAAWYCNRIGELEDIPESQHCYEVVGQMEGLPQYFPKRNATRLLGYRLPTDDEWELACRAGTTTPRSFGSDVCQLQRYANTGTEGVDRVATRLPNAFGLFDMHGNVSEWIHGAEYIDTPSFTGMWHVRCRGGSSWTSLAQVRSAARFVIPHGNTNERFGFRIARTLKKDGDES